VTGAGDEPEDPRPPRRWGSLCEDCCHVREVRSAKGSSFLMCRAAPDDVRWPKYPPQPVVSCRLFERYAPPA
jgi:hypothetical protein